MGGQGPRIALQKRAGGLPGLRLTDVFGRESARKLRTVRDAPQRVRALQGFGDLKTPGARAVESDAYIHLGSRLDADQTIGVRAHFRAVPLPV